MSRTIFERIISGDEPAFIIYENTGALAFLDTNPVSPGHTLVVPKSPATTLDDIDEHSLDEVLRAVKQVSALVSNQLNATGINVLHASGEDAQQSVPYFHVHVIPRFSADKKDFWPFDADEGIDVHSVAQKLS